MDNNGCGFQIEDDFSSRNSITSLLNPAAGGADAAAGASAPHTFYESIASYLENMNPRDHQGLLIRKGAAGLGDPQAEMENNNTSNSNADTAQAQAPDYSSGSVEHFETASQWQHLANSSVGTATRGGGAGSSASNGTAGRLSVDPAAASKVGKKRSRASRRAPTTVLTTDTSNFRAMVQEFTGIPPAPFASASPFPRARLDFLNGPRSLANPFLLRPFPQRMAAGAHNFAPSTAPSLQSLPQPPLFQSMLHPGGSNLVHKTTNTTSEAQMKAGLLEELGLNAHALPDLVPWHAGQDSTGACKMSYNKSAASGDPGRTGTLNLEEPIASTCEHHHGRPDRMVDSWISSSDQTLDKLVHWWDEKPYVFESALVVLASHTVTEMGFQLISSNSME